MFHLASESINYLLGRQTTLNTKMQQTCGTIEGKRLDHLEGSVAKCTVADGILTKIYRADAPAGIDSVTRTFRAAGWVLDHFKTGAGIALAGMADACEKEVDARHEFTIQEKFFLYTQQRHKAVRIPKPLGISGDGSGITMEYLGADTKRFCDVADVADRARAVVLISRLFFGAIEDLGLIHGDLSPTNVLIDANGRPCLVDFGCGQELSDGGAGFVKAGDQMNFGNNNEDTEFIWHLWEDRAWTDGWEVQLDAVKLNSLCFDGREHIPGLALCLRSLFALTLMAKTVPASSLRSAEKEWQQLNPNEHDIQQRRKALIQDHRLALAQNSTSF